jgi:hypothetical protein
VLSREASNTNVIVFRLTRPRPEPTIYLTRGEHANHHVNGAVCNKSTVLDTGKNKSMQKREHSSTTTGRHDIDEILLKVALDTINQSINLVFCVLFCRSLFVLLYVFCCPLCCLFFFDLLRLITALV